ncbi:MAG: hypothetical protein NTY22_07790 [Proteobacteria bacterium]|nr:hypothetical protein [Pseudomonadota bacterium]
MEYKMLTNENKNEINSCLVCDSVRHRNLQVFDQYKLLICNQCGFIWVSPQPSLDEYLLHHQNSFKGYYKQSIEDFYLGDKPIFHQEIKVKTKRLSFVQSLCKSNDNLRLLDIGTGQGLFPVLAKQLGWETYATELNEEEVNFLNKSKGIKCYSGDY